MKKKILIGVGIVLLATLGVYHISFVGLRDIGDFNCLNTTSEIDYPEMIMMTESADKDSGCDYVNCPPIDKDGKLTVKDLCFDQRPSTVKPAKGVSRQCLGFGGWKNKVKKEPVARSKCIGGSKKYKDPYLVKLAGEVGIKDAGQNKYALYLYDELLFEMSGKTDALGSVFGVDGNIAVKRGLGDELTKSVLVHEYIHQQDFIRSLTQDKNHKSLDNELTRELGGLYKSSSKMQNYVNSETYTETATNYAEHLAYACMAFRDNELSKLILDTCNNLIDRSKITID